MVIKNCSYIWFNNKNFFTIYIKPDKGSYIIIYMYYTPYSINHSIVTDLLLVLLSLLFLNLLIRIRNLLSNSFVHQAVLPQFNTFRHSIRAICSCKQGSLRKSFRLDKNIKAFLRVISQVITHIGYIHFC